MKLSLSLKFIIGCSLTLLFTLSATFYIINQRQEQLIFQQVKNEARAIFRQIVLMRQWIADHGGVFVERLPGCERSSNLGAGEIIDQQGRRFTRETPAMVTKELAQYAREEGLYWFSITSLELVNPENAPDSFEQDALLAFKQGELQEFIAVERTGQHSYLRFISPLFTEQSCLHCHRGYQVGDIRGALSVTIPLNETLAATTRNQRVMFGAMLLVVATLIGTLTLLLHRLVLAPVRRLANSMKQFSSGHGYDPHKLLRTGDELEELSRAFAEMAGRLTEYHHGLEAKVKAATQDLAELNRQLLLVNHQLNATSERKSDFIARASHELRTPLTSIKCSLEYLNARFATLSTEAADGCRLEEMSDFFTLIQNNTERLIRMVNTMLDLEQIEANASAILQPSHFDLAAVIAETLAAFTPTANQRQIKLQSSLLGALPISADEDRIRQVLNNLLANSLKFATSGSTVVVAARSDQQNLTVSVSDQGPGVPIEHRKNIFDKFYKIGNKEGSGLGLAICRSIVEAHGGAIGISERDDGGPGARFFFTLPVQLQIQNQSQTGKL